ncbi:MAG TPA: ABC transporter permease [Spirochaetales bacterium]|nr:ABC transporter permease [Spirochaetales bacterium]
MAKKFRVLETVDPNVLSSLGRVAALAIVCIGMGFISPVFFSPRNIILVVTNASVMAILGVGLTITVITCGPDLSVGSILTIAAVVAVIMVKAEVNFIIAFLAALLLGTLLGILNGFLVAKVGLPSFISTYGLQWALFGFAYVILKGYVIYDFDADFRFIGNGLFAGVVPMPIVVMLLVVALGWFILRKTTLGRMFYATGANKVAAQMSAINTGKAIFLAFGISGFLSALAGLVLVARINACQADIGKNILLSSLATVYMGGTRATGGQGGVFGTLIGALIMTVVENAMNLLGVPSVWRNAITGTLIIFTVLANLWVSNRLEKVSTKT